MADLPQEPWENGPPPGLFDEHDGVFPLRPFIRITAELGENADAAVRALAVDRTLYTRDGSLVHVVGAPTTDSERSAPVGGSPVVRTMAIATLRERLSRVARFLKPDARMRRGWRPTIPTDPIVGAVHARGEWPGLRELAGVIETPSMRPDGSILSRAGYDEATRYLFAPGALFPEVPDAPTQADAARALADLAEVFVDFPFASEAARYVPIAALLTMIARPAILGSVPLFLFDAATPGSGKTLCSDAVCIIATGRPAPRGTFPDDVEELEKVLSAYALQSAAVVGFDNVSGAIGGAPLDKVLTAIETVEMRVLGASTMKNLRWVAVVLASGNNVAVLRDTARRVLIARIESPLERPEEREGFKHLELRAYVREHRARLVLAALTILRAYVVAGRPRHVRAWGGFEPWAELVANAIVHAGGVDVLGARPSTDAGDDGERAAIGALLDGWARLAGPGGLTAKAALQLLYPAERAAGPPDGYDDLREAIEVLAPPRATRTPDPTALGRALRRIKGRVVGGRRLVVTGTRSAILRWGVAS